MFSETRYARNGDLRVVHRRIDKDRTLDVSRREDVADQTSKRQSDRVQRLLLLQSGLDFSRAGRFERPTA